MNRPGFNFLVCPDSILCRQEMEKITEKHLEDNAIWKFFTCWGDEEPPPALWKNLSQAGLFAENKIIIVRHAELWNASVWKELTAVLGKHIEHAWPFFYLEGAWEKGKPKIPAHIQKSRPYLYAVQNKWTWQSPGLAGQSLREFIKTNSKKLGLKFSDALFTSFATSVGGDGQTILNELEKIFLLSDNGQVSPDMITDDVTAMESNAFAMVRNITNGNITAVWKDLANANESMLFLIIALFAREFRTLWQINMGEKVNLYPQDSSLKRNAARKLGMDGIAQGFAALAHAEYMVKNGQQTPEQTLEILSVELCRLFTT